LKVGSYGQKLWFNLLDDEGEPLDLANATSVILYLKVGTVVKDFVCDIEDEEGGQVSYVVEDGDLDKAGTGEFEIEVNYEHQKFISEDKITEPIKKRVAPQEE
jgi:hypothetical protein